MTTINLSKPLQTHKGEVKELELKEPTAGAFVNNGADPFKVRMVGDRIELDYNNVAMMSFLAEMSGIDSLILKSISASDYMRARDAAAKLILGIAGDNAPFDSSNE